MGRAWTLLAALVPALASAQAYQRTQLPDQTVCLFWPDRAVTLRPNGSGSARTPGETEFSALESAVQAWARLSRECSDFFLELGTRTTADQVGYVRGGENENLVLYRERDCADVVAASDGCHTEGTCGNVHGCWEHGDGILALTTTTFSTRTGAFVDGDIELNAGPRGYLFTTVSSPPCAEGVDAVTCVSTDVQNTLTHELGHLLGFDHVEDPSSTMAPTAPPGELSKRLLDVGTREGFCHVYPRGRPSPPCLGPSVSVVTAQARASGCGAGPGEPAAWAVLLVGGLCLGARLRQT